MSTGTMHKATINPRTGDLQKARDLVGAIRALKACEADGRPATRDERAAMGRFGGFGAVALSIFPDPTTRAYKTPSWTAVGEELRSLLTEQEYDSAKRSTFTAFYTAPAVMDAMFRALSRLGVPADGTALEPGCGIGRFMDHAPRAMRFVGVERDLISGRIARARFPGQDIRVEDFRETNLVDGSLDAAIGNPPFADLKVDYRGDKLALHDFFIAKSLDALKPGGVLALVTSHFTLDKLDGTARARMADRADFFSALRLPSDAFKAEGTSVVTDVLFFKKRGAGLPVAHNNDAWLEVGRVEIEGVEVPINRFFITTPDLVLGDWSRQDTLYGSEQEYSLVGDGKLAGRLEKAMPARWAYPADEPEDEEEAVEAPAPAAVPAGDWAAHEGRFIVGDDRIVRQVEGGSLAPVVYGGVGLRSDGTMTGRRLADLVGLRDLARKALRVQNEGRPEVERSWARDVLNEAYDGFVAAYGPINKTSISESADGTVIRRMPNVVKFREDPDAMLVLALEEYDEATGTAARAPILLRDVVGPRPAVERVESAEDGLLASLDLLGEVDVPFISSIYGKSRLEVVDELGDLIYRDPATDSWQTADVYLSGNVRAKLSEAEAAGPGFASNAEALRAVQPEDILPGDIEAHLGSPWVPADDVRAFAAHLFGVDQELVRVGHLRKDAVWSLEVGYLVLQAVSVTSDYGTDRVLGTTLLEQALNMRSPAIYDEVMGPDGKETRVLNRDATLAASEKQRLIKAKFKAWAFADQGRSERLVRIYNDTYNNIRLRVFDGSHLEFPGMSGAVTLDGHQRDGAWRVMSGGNTLLAHVVGAGKTFTMAAAAMKLRKAGIARKPLFVVPNHVLEQFAREFMHLYPNARLLVAGKEDMTKGRRKLLTAKVAGGDWDGVIVTHSGFERIGMSREYQARFIRDQLREYEELLIDARKGDGEKAHRNIIKNLEKQKEKRELRLKDLLAGDKKDDGLVFEELGVDYLFVDEAHYFKNLECPTKMDRVAGIQTGGSERAFDLFMKCRYLGRINPGKGVTFATGTPISNTMVEMYTMQRFLDPEGLESREIGHFDAWAATFGEVVESMEISPDGASLRPRARFARFVNLPELVQLFRSFADVQTAAMLDLPRPGLVGGKAEAVACRMSEEQAALQEGLVKRYERIRNGRVDPKEDNALAITTDGRKLSLDARMLGATDDFPGSKVNAMVANVARTWAETAAGRSTQMVFCDLGVNPNPHSVYDDVVAKLVAIGIPAAEVAVMGDADSDARKRILFEKVRAGVVRVLIGSTNKMGTGTNVQKRLIALHHLDAPWKPAEVEQREGRILRQGNSNPEVAIYRYVTAGSFDAFMWQALETKARFIAQVMSGGSSVRKAEDIGGQELSYAEVKAIASGNPAVLTLAEADAELQRLWVLRREHADRQYVARKNVRDLPVRIADLERKAAGLAADLATMAAHDDGSLAIDGRSYGKDLSFAAVGKWLKDLPVKVDQATRFPIGTAKGLAVGLVMHRYGGVDLYLEGAASCRITLKGDHPGPRAILNAIDNLASDYPWERDSCLRSADLAKGQLEDYRERTDLPFPHEDYLAELGGLRDRLQACLSRAENPAEGEETSADVARLVDALRGRNVVEAAQQPAGQRAESRSGEEPIAARIRRTRAANVATGSGLEEAAEAVEAPPVEVAEVVAAEVLVEQPPTFPELVPAAGRPARRQRAAAAHPAIEAVPWWDGPAQSVA